MRTQTDREWGAETGGQRPVRNRARVFGLALWVAGAVLVSSGATGCRQQPVAGAKAPGKTVETHLYLDHAQAKLPTLELWLGPAQIQAELATTTTEIMTGMMYRKKMGENEGMLFVFDVPERASFYMRNTYIPLSCAYIDPDGVILELHDMKPLDETAIEAASDHVQYVLETKQGWFKRHHVTTGMVVRSERGSLRQVFFGETP